LPKEFFSTRKKVQDLVNLTGDASFVEQQASNHVARVLKDADAKGIKNYMEKNAEWLDLMPNLRARLQNHYSAVASSERIVPKTGALAKALKTEVQALPSVRQTEAEKIQKEAAKAAEDVLSGGKKEAKRLTSEGAAEAGKVKYSGEKFEPLVGPGDTMTQIRKLITGGNTELLRRAAPSIKSDPEVARAFKEAVKLELSQLDPRSLAGGKNTRSEWETKLKPALLETGLIDSRLAKQISDRMKIVELTMEPNQKAQALFFILRQTLAGKLGEMETGK
jgi:cell division septum initiation protein DivIVA